MSFTIPTLTSMAFLVGMVGLSAQDVDRGEARTSIVAAPHARLRGDRLALGLNHDHDFRFHRGHKGEDGIVHNRFHQTYRGVRVWGSEVITHTHENGVERRESTRMLYKGIRLSVEPTLGQAEVLSVVANDLSPKGPYAHEPRVELVIYPREVQKVRAGRERKRALNAEDVTNEVERYVLAYHIHTELENDRDPLAHTDYLIDAHTGEILNKWSTLMASEAQGMGYSQYNGVVTLSTNNNNGLYELKDLTRDSNYVTNMNFATTGAGTLYTDEDNTWGDGQSYLPSNHTASANGQTPAVDAAYALQVTWDMFKNVLGRAGIRGPNIPIYIRIHYGINVNNAYYHESCRCVSLGDGDLSLGQSNASSIHTVAHELGHAFCAGSARLFGDKEAGGLNESNADITAAMAYFYTRKMNATGSSLPLNVDWADDGWVLRYQEGSHIRNMAKPSKDGKSFDAWYSNLGSNDSHYSSGPGNRMFVFLTCGASSDSTSDNYSSYVPSGFSGIGADKAFRIWYKAMTSYLGEFSNYASARTACLNAASDLYGIWSPEYKAVMNAYAAINVGYPPPDGVKLLIDPVKVTLLNCAKYPFKAEVQGTANSAVTWTCSEGSIDEKGIYTAPILPGIYTVKATSVEDKTQSAIATVTVSNNRIINGNFDTYNMTPWSATPGLNGGFSNHPAYEGKNYIRFGGMGRPLEQILYQTVSIPDAATKATLNFYLDIETDETTTDTPKDTLSVNLRDTSGTILSALATYSNLDKNSGYEQKTFDLSAYRGKTFQIHFLATEDSATKTLFCLDKVSLIAE